MKSKRNNLQIKNQHVVKTFIHGNFELECNIYRLLELANVRHASVIEAKDNQLTLEYLEGPCLLDILIDCEQRNDSFVPYLDLWFNYMLLFYDATKQYRHGDVHLSNFLLVNHEVIGLDFEQAMIENSIKDITDIICYTLFYEPVLTEYKKRNLREWFNKHPWRDRFDDQTWLIELNGSLQKLNIRRGTTYKVDWSFIL